jgi:mevalonate kinase
MTDSTPIRPMIDPFLVSAPGKVIIFGEHSAVYAKPAIAAALSLRAYLLVTPSTTPDIVRLDFPDIGLSQSWKVSELPWEKVLSLINYTDLRPSTTDELVPEITDLLGDSLSDLESRLHYTACHCFLYLYMNLCTTQRPSVTFCVRSTLPIGAGLGSSASTAVCLSSALAVLGGHVGAASYKVNDHVKQSHTTPQVSDAEFIDSWSLMGEKCFHGNPSGIDNAVATHGGAVLYQRMQNPAQPSVRTTMPNLPPIKLLLTNTKVPRLTADLVSNVGRINHEFPKVSGCILNAMEHLTNEAYHYMVRPFFGLPELAKLRELVEINHGLLVSLGVSHPALEKIKIITGEKQIGATKLTGAGGGGCAITLVNDECLTESIAEAIAEFEKAGFETFETSLGGKGVGALHYENVDPAARATTFDISRFAGFRSREEIIAALGVDTEQGWRFW